MVEWLRFTLRVWDRSGRSIDPVEVFGRLSLNPIDPILVLDGPGVPRLQLLFVSIEDVTAGVDRCDEFASRVKHGLLQAADWLGRQPAAVFDEFRASGYVTDVFVGAWITVHQFDLDLPPEFLAACGNLGLTVSMCTND